MNIVFDEYLCFPADTETENHITRLIKILDCVEGIENAFNIEFSCGDGLYLSDHEDNDAMIDKYDGEVCTKHPPRERNDGKEFKANKPYRFTIKYSEEDYEAIGFVNSKEVSRFHAVWD